jgi:hypothetical protein
MENKKCDCKDCQCGGTKQSTTGFSIWDAPDWSIFSNPDWVSTFFQGDFYDPEKYDLVEKKDYKIKILKNSIESTEIFLSQLEEKYKEYQKNITQCEKDIKQLKQELQELESKKKE